MSKFLPHVVTMLRQFSMGLVQGLGCYIGFTMLIKNKNLVGKKLLELLVDNDSSSTGETTVNVNNSDVKNTPTSTNVPIETTEELNNADNNASVVSSQSASMVNGQELVSIPGVVEERVVEILVHNVSHGDMVLGLSGSDIIPEENPDSTNFVLCHPRFSAFDMFSRRILNSAFPVSSPEIISFPRYERRDTRRHSLVKSSPSRQTKLPIGFHFSKNDNAVPLLHEELPWLRIRGRDSHRVKGLDERMKEYQRQKLENHSPPQNDEAPEKNDNLYIDAIFFPLISTLLIKWEQQYNLIKQKKIKKVLVLVSGVSMPRNYTHSLTGNSTRYCAELMEIYIKELYPDVTVVRIHSEESNILRYDENLTFVKRKLIPCIDAYRDAHARGLPYPDEDSNKSKNVIHNEFDTEWKDSFNVTLSFADGCPARTYAIQASLRPYKPTYYHVWQLKTFWHNAKVCDDDIEIHSHDEMETTPATEISAANNRVQSVVKEIMNFKQEFLMKLTQSNDLTSFWLRKTKKPVLAVLLVKKQNGIAKLYRGTNMEVSMPTGSLCAERNVIGTALATDPSLRREDLRMVAVLSLPLPDQKSINISIPKQLALKSESSKDADNEVISLNTDSLPNSPDNAPFVPRSTSVSSFTSFVLEDNEETKKSEDHNPKHVVFADSTDGDDSLNASISFNDKKDKSSATTTTTAAPAPAPAGLRRINLYNTNTDFDKSVAMCKMINNNDNQNPSLRNKRNNKKFKKTVVVHSCKDINPLKPCGACNEWLKKIAESNPHFKILTFTDADCNGVYIQSCQE